MDAARIINKKNAKKVVVIYRRARAQMPAEDREVEDAIKEGVEFLFQNNIVKILGKNRVEEVECIKTELVKVEGDRERPVNIEGSNYLLDMDYVVMALGSKPQRDILDRIGIEKSKHGYVEVDENKMTSLEKVFASGDLIGEKSTVAWASRSGRDAAEKIIEYLEK